jgi:hypothetical protein
MPQIDIKRLTPALNLILMQELLFLTGAFAAAQLGWLFNGKTLIIMVVTILPLLLFVLMFIAAYKIVTALINYFFKEVNRLQKTLLIISGLVSLLLGFGIVL